MLVMAAALVGLGLLWPGSRTIDALILLAMFAAFGLLLFGGFVRPLQKALYHRFSEDLPFYRRVVTLFPLRHWLWLTPEGKDRDA